MSIVRKAAQISKTEINNFLKDKTLLKKFKNISVDKSYSYYILLI